MARNSGRRAVAITAFVILSLGGLGAAGAVLAPRAGQATATAERPAQPVRVTEIAFTPTTRAVTYTGTIRPRHEVAMGFRLSGKIVSRRVEVGDAVTAGTVLATLDDTDARLERDVAAAEVAAAEVDHRRARADIDRTQTLFDKGHVAQAALDRALSVEAEAAARADRARRSLALAENGLGYTRLLAPADGVITATPGEAGQVVAAGTPVVSIAQGGAVDVVFSLPEDDRDLLAGSTARAEIWGAGAVSHPLVLRDIAPDADPQGRTYRVRMALADPGAGASFGRTVTISVTPGAGAPVATVPLAAVQDAGAGPAVWRVTGDRVERVPVELAAVTDTVATIRGALRPGDRIVSLGAHKLDPDRPVRVVEIQTPVAE
ncbi:efflux RND transporter periplasmic adaptor subunit [Paragemmobacter ruber]|uniref:Efflux RND transporter periplasmic adaptor subunit n=1 Tax=Paragemmobacter ruber TaxID=1985673 RepID=A0ABW9Y6L4_9RHOB|nr:efflux RND transporter periplasmic adaptor subunit [Rhodobacter ruber]NBE08188.1 efflux RND transporter periplasmic adaptor subunit [Rhodobacter ruber]